MSEFDPDKTPILLHPAKRTELFTKGQDLFNDEKFFEAHEAWEELWHVENGRDKIFVQGLIQVAAHFVHTQKGNWSGAKAVAAVAREKLQVPPVHRLYRELDIEPLTAAMIYNVGLLIKYGLGMTITIGMPGGPPPVPEAFMIPKLFN